jgi:vitamin K-dependent gamma-carboxylase
MQDRSLPNAFAKHCLNQKDIAAAAFFRVIFGFTGCYWAWDYLTTGRVTRLYVAPEFHFGYPLFDFVQPLPGNGMYLLFVVMFVLALLIGIGWFYRAAATSFALCFTYFFLLERTNYQNHYYLICLIAWVMPLLPLNSLLSVDCRSGRITSNERTPAWVYWVLQFLIGLPYFFGGVAKLTPDWLLGQPMGIFLSTKSEIPLIGGWLAMPGTAILISIGGLIFDTAVVPLLIWPKTRMIAYVFCILFHITNATLFQIHIFPWFMILASTIYFSPSWPRWILGAPPIEAKVDESPVPSSTLPRWAILIAGLFVAFHCLWPLRSRLNNEETSWTERGHLFSWRMMLRAKEVGIGYAVVDSASGRAANVDHKQFLDPEQAEKFARDPELIRQMAHFIANKFEKETRRRPEVHAFALASLNGRKPQLMIDPNVDLAAQPAALWNCPSWIVPLKEPFCRDAWKLPIDQWKSHVELPEIKFLEQMKQQSANRSAENPKP